MNEINITCYVDMDGVLADFDKGFYDISGGIESNKVSDSELWSIIDAYGKSKFFSELPWMVDGKELWSFVIQNFLNVKILSALGKTDKVDKLTSTGKREWLSHNIPSLTEDDIILVDNKHQKKRWSKPGDIIIDDTEIVIQEWNKKGGIGILHKTAAETINILKRYV